MLDVFVAIGLNRAYVNLHTKEYPEGEISGEITKKMGLNS